MNESQEVNPVVLPTHAWLLLRDKPKLLALYTDLLLLDSIGVLESVNLTGLSEILGISVQHLSKQCTALTTRSLLEKNSVGRSTTYKIVYPAQFGDSEYLTELLKVNSLSNNKELKNKLNNLTKKIQQSVVNKETKKVKLNSILNIYNPNILNKNYNKKRFPAADYEKVLAAYEEYTGAIRKGPELSQPRKAIRLMFLAERSPDDIISFMKWLHTNAGEKGYEWLKVWDMWLVQKKLPDFLAGRFDDDDYDDGFKQL